MKGVRSSRPSTCSAGSARSERRAPTHQTILFSMIYSCGDVVNEKRKRSYGLLSTTGINLSDTVSPPPRQAGTVLSYCRVYQRRSARDPGIALVECPDCARTRTLSPRNEVLRFPAHSKRKTRTPNTEQRWAMEKTIWEVVGGERK